MPDTKLDLKNLGSVRLMEIDTSTLFVPFGRPITDYLLGVVGNQNGTRALLKQGAIDFSPEIRWKDSTASLLHTTGFGELEREGLLSSAAAAEPADPLVADFLPFERPGIASQDGNQARILPAIAAESLPVLLPRISALPLRPRMTFGPPPAAKAKPAAAPPAAKPAVAPLKPTPIVAPKPVAPAPPPKAAAPAPVQAKPVAAIPPAPKPAATPVAAPKPAAPPASPKVNVPAAPAARTAEPNPAGTPSPTPKPAPSPSPAARSTEAAPSQPKPNHTPLRAPVSPARAQESAVSALETPATAPAKPVAAAQPMSKAPAAAPASPKPPALSGRTPATISILEPQPASRPKPEADAPTPKPQARTFDPPPLSNEPNLSMGIDAESRSFLEKVPLPAKIGIAILLILAAMYFIFGKSDKPAGRGVVVGEQGWSTEWASDAGGSRRGRQITLYRPSTGLSDYQMQFTGQIESKALGWVFRAADTKNYYAMKLENLRPGVMALTHFAVVEGRESSNSQRPLSIDARPGATYRVKLDVTGPRFTISIGGEPVDFWTDNRIKAGAVGFMNERDERGATSSVQFSFPQGMK